MEDMGLPLPIANKPSPMLARNVCRGPSSSRRQEEGRSGALKAGLAGHQKGIFAPESLKIPFGASWGLAHYMVHSVPAGTSGLTASVVGINVLNQPLRRAGAG